ncbi:MAG: ATP-binding protein, partial [Cyanobacteria bacterium P01_D01_bin.14]
AFPGLNYNERIDRIPEIFDTPETLIRLCNISGGHMRNLMRLLYGCLQKQDPPIHRTTLEAVIRDERDALMALIDEQEWQLLFQAIREPDIQGNEAYNQLLRSLFLYEYRDQAGRWFALNPVLAETRRFAAWKTAPKDAHDQA